MNYEIDRKKIRNLDIGFRRVSSRLLRTKYRNEHRDLERFLSFIESEPMLQDFIDTNNTVSFNITDIVESIGYHDKYDMPVNKSEEIAWIYQMLLYSRDNKIDFWRLGQGYGSGTKIQDCINAFCDQVIKPLIDHISDYICEVMIEMGFEDNASTIINISASKSQVNVANDNGSIGDVNQQYYGEKTNDIELIERIIKGINCECEESEAKESIVDDLDSIKEQLESSTPKRTRIQKALSSLKKGIEAVALSTGLIANLDQLFETLMPIIDKLP